MKRKESFQSPYHFLTTCADEPKPPLGAVTTSSCTSTLAFSSTFCAAAPRCINCAAATRTQKRREMPASPRRQKNRGRQRTGTPHLQVPQGARDLPLRRHRSRRRKSPLRFLPYILFHQSPKFRVRVLGARGVAEPPAKGSTRRNKTKRVRRGAEHAISLAEPDAWDPEASGMRLARVFSFVPISPARGPGLVSWSRGRSRLCCGIRRRLPCIGSTPINLSLHVALCPEWILFFCSRAKFEDREKIFDVCKGLGFDTSPNSRWYDLLLEFFSPCSSSFFFSRFS